MEVPPQLSRSLCENEILSLDCLSNGYAHWVCVLDPDSRIFSIIPYFMPQRVHVKRSLQFL